MLTILLLALGKYFSVLPKAVLASIVVVNLRQVFKLTIESLVYQQLIGCQIGRANVNFKTLSRGMLRQILQLPDLLRMVLRIAERLPEMCMGES